MKLLLNSVAVAITALLVVSTVEAHPDHEDKIHFQNVTDVLSEKLVDIVANTEKFFGMKNTNFDKRLVKGVIENPLELIKSMAESICKKQTKESNPKVEAVCKTVTEILQSQELRDYQTKLQNDIASIWSDLDEAIHHLKHIPGKIASIANSTTDVGISLAKQYSKN